MIDLSGHQTTIARQIPAVGSLADVDPCRRGLSLSRRNGRPSAGREAAGEGRA